MKIVILGGTGFIGSYLKTYLTEKGHSLSVWGREAFSESFDLPGCLNDQDLLIMLAGENIGKRWSKAYKKALLDSRIKTSRRLKKALEECVSPPKKILAASAIGIYPESDCKHSVDESVKQTGDNFLATLGLAWEQQNSKLAPKPVIMRFGVVLGKNGGALAKMLPPFKLGLGGPVAGGKQCFSWVHIKDLARVIAFLIEHSELEGVFNITAPQPLSNDDFGRKLATELRRPYLLPLPLWQLKLMFGEGAQVLRKSVV